MVQYLLQIIVSEALASAQLYKFSQSAMCLLRTPYILKNNSLTLIVVGRFIHSGLNRSHAMQVVAACSGK